MHVKLVVNSFPTASETFLFNLVTGLEKKGVKVTVYAKAGTKDIGLYVDQLKDWSGNIQQVSLKGNSFSNIVRMAMMVIINPLFFLKMVREKGIKQGCTDFLNICFLLKGKPDIIHFSFSGLGITYLGCLPHLEKLLVKTVVSCRGTAEKVKPLLEADRGEKMRSLFSQIDLIHCVSKDMRDGLVSFGLVPEKTFINYPSIETGKFLKSKSVRNGTPDKTSIVTIGRLHFQKGYIFALQAMKILKDRGFNFLYHVLGEGPDRPMITYAIYELGLTHEVKLYGRVSSLQVFERLKNADIFLLPSVYEGVANAALEAMAMEVPLITTRAGGMSEVIQDRINGLLVDCFDGLAIANALTEVLSSPELRLLIAKNGRDTIEKNFKLEKQIDIFLTQYISLLGKRDYQPDL